MGRCKTDNDCIDKTWCAGHGRCKAAVGRSSGAFDGEAAAKAQSHAASLPDARCDIAKDPVVERNRQMLLDRSNLGIQKYGKTLAGNPLTHKQWLQHALEEALDLANYLQAEIMKIEAEEAERAIACTHLRQKWNLFMTVGQCIDCGVKLRAPVNAIRPVEAAGGPQEAPNEAGPA